MLHNRAKGDAWGRTLPPGYGLSFVGVLMFGAGGMSDVLWHRLFGVEQSLEALYSPSHFERLRLDRPGNAHRSGGRRLTLPTPAHAGATGRSVSLRSSFLCCSTSAILRRCGSCKAGGGRQGMATTWCTLSSAWRSVPARPSDQRPEPLDGSPGAAVCTSRALCLPRVAPPVSLLVVRRYAV
jgi:hypothetical protein